MVNKQNREHYVEQEKQMWQSAMLHGVFVAVLQVALGFSTDNWWAGGLAGVMFFLGREHMGQQKKMAEAAGGSVKDLKPWDGFDMTKWGKDSVLDLCIPVAAASAITLAKLSGLF